MNVLNPWAIFVGVAALALPVLIHWLTRPRPRRVPLSTVRFLMEAVKERKAAHRLRDWIILLLRTAAVALLAWAFARPLLGVKAVKEEAGGEVVRVVVLDQSQSMGATAGGVSSFERGRPVAAKHLEYDPSMRGALILAAAKAR